MAEREMNRMQMETTDGRAKLPVENGRAWRENVQKSTSIEFCIPLLGAALAVCIMVATPVVADDKNSGAQLSVGTLTCKGKGSIGLILGSKQTLKCTYQPSNKQPPEHYTATITKLGLDIGVKGASTVIWGVLSSSTELPAWALEGSYGGVSANASLGVGVGANALVGGSKKSVVLQPLSVQGQTGVNLAAGIAGVKLNRN